MTHRGSGFYYEHGGRKKNFSKTFGRSSKDIWMKFWESSDVTSTEFYGQRGKY